MNYSCQKRETTLTGCCNLLYSSIHSRFRATVEKVISSRERLYTAVRFLYKNYIFPGKEKKKHSTNYISFETRRYAAFRILCFLLTRKILTIVFLFFYFLFLFFFLLSGRLRGTLHKTSHKTWKLAFVERPLNTILSKTATPVEKSCIEQLFSFHNIRRRTVVLLPDGRTTNVTVKFYSV